MVSGMMKKTMITLVFWGVLSCFPRKRKRLYRDGLRMRKICVFIII